MNIKNINVFIPDCVKQLNTRLIKGYTVKFPNNLICLYIIDSSNQLSGEFTLAGDVYKKKSKLDITSLNYPNYISFVVKQDEISIEYLKIDDTVVEIKDVIKNTVILFYNYSSFLNSEDLSLTSKSCNNSENDASTLNQFQILKKYITNKSSVRENEFYDESNEESPNKIFLLRIIINVFLWASQYSNLFLHMCTMAQYIQWIVSSLFKNRKISVKVGNLIVALIVDLVAGIFILRWINQWSPTLVSKLFDLVYIIIPTFQKLITWLMGSPAGLKLNHAFNTMLGNFFLYHIDLWWMFLEICRYSLEIAIQIFQYLGMLGISFQAAIVTDLVSLATFHVYCIYIYAARLYNVQLSGLIALWRLFLGRKYNPLREIVDSCSYNHHQLFIGTLGFTILLFLLPTTLMYYAVFTTFRVIVLILTGLLKWIQFVIQSLPLYLILLWLIRSQRIAGNIHISFAPNFDVNVRPLVLTVQLKFASVLQLVQKYKAEPIPAPPKINYKQVFTTLWRGNVLNAE